MLKYLKNINFNGSVAFIDVGWKCSTQNALSHFGNVDIWGLYLGIHPHAKEDVHGKGYLFDKEYSNYFYTVMGGMSLLEAFFTAPEKSLKKYEMNDSDDDVCFEYEIGDSKDNIVIGNVGRFSAQKNHRYFLDLAEKLDNKFVFLLLGNGELKEEFIEKVKECGLEDKFRVVSAKTDVERYYSAMDVFVMPSIFEGLPITAIEAQCNGLPCVFSTYITQQVKLSSNCEFVDLEDKGKWIEVISNFSKSRYDGVKVITDNKFDLDSTVKMMEMIFEEL